MRVKVHIDKQSYKNKPSKDIVKNTLNRRVVQTVSEVTPQELAEYVGEKGHTMVLGLMNGKRTKNNLIEQHLVALDFDNKEDGEKTEGIFYQTIEGTLEDEFIKENASFIYKTFSHSENWEKFRVVFILDKPLQDNDEVEQAYQFLMDKFPNADKGTKDSSRIFFGGTQGVTEIDFNNTLSKDSLGIEKTVKKQNKPVVEVVRMEDILGEDTRPTHAIIADSTMPYPLRLKEVSERWSQYGQGKIFADESGAYEFVRQLPMDKMLGVGASPFINILEFEENPSASIWKPEDTNTYLYTEFNRQGKNGKNRSYDIIQIVEKLLHKGNMGKDATRTASMDFLISATGIKIEATEELADIHRQANKFKSILLSDTLKKQHPEMYQIFGRYNYVTDVNAIIDIFKSNIYENKKTGEIESLHWGSIENLALRLSISKKKAKNLVNLMTLTGISNKLTDEQIPESLLKILKENQTHIRKSNGELVERKKERKRRSTVYELNELDTNFQKLKKGV